MLVLANILWLAAEPPHRHLAGGHRRSLPPRAARGRGGARRRLRTTPASAISGTGSGALAARQRAYPHRPGRPERDRRGAGFLRPQCRRAAALAGRPDCVGRLWSGSPRNSMSFPLLLQRPASRPWEIMREALLIALAYPLSSLSLLRHRPSSSPLPPSLLAGPVLFVFFSAMAMMQTVALRQVLVQRGEHAARHAVNDRHESDGPLADRLRQRQPHRRGFGVRACAMRDGRSSRSIRRAPHPIRAAISSLQGELWEDGDMGGPRGARARQGRRLGASSTP